MTSALTIILFAYAVDWKIEKMKESKVTLREQKLLPIRSYGIAGYIILALFPLSLALEPYIYIESGAYNFIVYLVLVLLLFYGKVRAFFEAKQKKMNKSYINLSLCSILVFTLAGSVVVLQKAMVI